MSQNKRYSDNPSEKRPAYEKSKGNRAEGRNERDFRREKPIRNAENNAEKLIEKEIREDIIEGRNAVIEALKANRTIEQIFMAKGDIEGAASVIAAMAKEKGIVVKEVDRKKLDRMSETKAHQGVIAQVTPYSYYEIEDILDYAEEKGEKPFILILDEIEDPHNFGAIIRTAEVSGVHGIIIPKRRNVGVTSAVYKSSAGAAEYMKITKVSNLNNAIDRLKKEGIWIYGADMVGNDYCYDIDFSGAAALVIGSEGRGISRLTKEKCDVLVKIPMLGKINSLNASVAGSIIMYEVLRQKLSKK